MIRCLFCKATVNDLATATDAEWIPSFYDGDREVAKPVCPSCTSARMELGEDGEQQLAEHTAYADEAESAQRGNAWPQAAALWQRAADMCQDAGRKAYYEKQVAWCRDMTNITPRTET